LFMACRPVEGERAPLWSGALQENVNSSYFLNNGSQLEPKVQAHGLLGSQDACVVTFHIAQEDHTLGNVVRYLAGRDKRTQLVGYSVPHPSEYAINMRIQGYFETPAVNILEDTLTNLIKICDHMTQTFDMEVHKQRANTTE